MAATRRGAANATRERLLAAAARCFARDGYFGTDSNKIARAAGFAPGTFYKHFPNKRAALLAAYSAWVSSEWEAIESVLEAARAGASVTARLARSVIAHHRKWAGLRRSLRAGAATDDVVRDFQLGQRKRQLEWLSARRGAATSRARNLALLLELERLCDAIAEGDSERLGVSNAALTREVERVLESYLA